VFKKLVKKFEDLQVKHVETGAGDTEPDWVFQKLIINALQGKPSQLPLSAVRWELFNHVPSLKGKVALAVKELNECASEVVDCVKQIQVGDKKKIKEVKDYCWRIDTK